MERNFWKVDRDKLAGLILSNELSVKDVADKIGISSDRVQRWINEEDVPNLSEVDKLEDIFSVACPDVHESGGINYEQASLASRRAGQSKGSDMEQQKLDQAKADFIDNHGELIKDLAGRVGQMVNEGDFISIAMMAHYTDFVFKKADQHYQHNTFTRAPIRVN